MGEPVDAGSCMLAGWPDAISPEIQERVSFSKAKAFRKEGGGAGNLVTAPDFGCVQFEAKG
jgi:hypothetical protein